MEEEDELKKKREEEADSKFRDVKNEHTVEYAVNETMSPQEFRNFQKKLEEKGL